MIIIPTQKSQQARQRFLLACLLALCSSTPLAMPRLHAAEASQGTGVISGRVLNSATGKYLANAVVRIEGTQLETHASDDGYYRFSGLPSGRYTVSASYEGLDIMNQAVVVSENQSANVDFALSSGVYQLEAFVVSSEREGNARAMHEQREASNIKSIVAADSFGNMVDGNIGELMKNLPGITVDYSGEDASAIRFRGMDPNLSSVTMDGNPLASNSGGTSRSFSLLDFAVQNIETIELDIAPTPDRPGNSMGGSINFKTKSAFSQKGRRIRVDSNLSLNTEALDFKKTPGGSRTPDRKLMPGFTLSYTESFGDTHPVGIALNTNFSQKYRFNNSYSLPGGYTYNQSDLEANGGIVSAGMPGVIPSVLWQESGAASERRFVSLNLDKKLSASTSAFLYTSYTRDTGLGGYTHAMRVTAGSQPSTASFDRMVSPSGTSLGMSASVSNNDTQSYSINPGIKHRFGDFELTYDVYLSSSAYKPNPDSQFSIGYGMTGVGLNIDGISGNATGKITQTAGSDYTNISNYNSLSLYNDYTYGDDQQTGAKLDAKLPVRVWGMPVSLQSGGRFNEQTRNTQRFYRKYDLTGDSKSSTFGTAAEPKLKQFADPYFLNHWNFNVPIANWLNPYAVYDYFRSAPGQFYDNVVNTYDRETGAKKDTKESVYAGYFMATAKVNSRLTVLTGARYELTELKATGMVYDSSTNLFSAGGKFDTVTTTSPYYGISTLEQQKLRYTETTREKNYDKIFPNLQLRFTATANLIFRAAVTTNIGRPNFSSLLPGDTVYDHYNLIKRNNTNLLPQEGTNIDLSAEYYLPNNGRLSLTGFHQKISRYIVSVENVEYIVNSSTGLTEPWTVETSENAGNGKNTGFEISYLQRLGFISPKLKGFEFYSAFSMANPTAEYNRRTGYLPDNPTTEQAEAYLNGPTERTTIPLTNVIKRSANVRLGYRGVRFFGSIGAYWRDEFARSINTTTLEKTMQASDIRVDLSLGCKLSSRWETYLDWRNLTNEPDQRAIFNRTGGYFTSGMVFNVGIRANL